MRALFCVGGVRSSLRSFSSKNGPQSSSVPPPPPRVEEAEFVKAGTSGGATPPTNPFSDSFSERYSPHWPQLIHMVIATIMLTVSVKLWRHKGESNEREARYVDRITRVRLELDAVPDLVVTAVVEALTQDAKLSREAAFLKSEDGVALVRQLTKEATLKAMENAKAEAVKQFEAKLWEEVPQGKEEATKPATAAAAVVPEKPKVSNMY